LMFHEFHSWLLELKSFGLFGEAYEIGLNNLIK